jgi:D-alanine-D-alanine ligase-like ATP-grasp enzyme
MPRPPSLVLVYETEAACRRRLADQGFDPTAVLEISSYLAQSTDLAREFEAIAEACTLRGIDFVPIEVDQLSGAIGSLDPASTLLWTLTDGIAYFQGSVAPALAQLHGIPTFGSAPSLFALAQDKFRSGAALRALGLPCPQAGVARNGEWIVPPPESERGWFVKPNRLGAKIGIWSDSHVQKPDQALELSRRVFAAYRDDVVVQPYVPGRNVRASFLAVAPDASVEALGAVFVDSGGDFQTMEDSLALYGETGDAAKAAGAYAEPKLVSVAEKLPNANAAIREMAATMMRSLGLRDVFSVDLRVEEDDRVHLIEFEVCPGLPCFDFRDYCQQKWEMSLPEAMAQAAMERLRRGSV